MQAPRCVATQIDASTPLRRRPHPSSVATPTNRGGPMRIESSVTSLTWIPSEAIEGMPKLPFELGLTHYDDPPPDRLVDLDAMHEHDMFRQANELKAFIEVEDGEILGQGY